ncbi:SpoIIE family protein phosphatase [Pseudonocardia sp. H11422]|uniref:SpoIIE family protein phosphatase n=1 Tax=Pseudonocardia sp. H11422 TaxID=2835866 RepID=UPI001BDD4F22|nr:SpoIIE family protein phosphatase [Pseudonocardia sp. H11422]
MAPSGSDALAQVPFPAAITRGPDHVIELLNPPARELLGARDLVGRPLREALPELAGQGLADLLDRTYRADEACQDPEQRVLLRDGDRTVEHWFSLGCSPLRQADGAVSGLVVYALQTTEQVLALRRAEFLVRLGQVLRDSPPRPVEMVQRAAELVVAGLADRCRIELSGPDGTPRHVADVCDGESSSPDHRSGVVVPLVVPGRELGTLAVCSADADRFTGAELALVRDVASHLAAAVDDTDLRNAQEATMRLIDAARTRSAALLTLAEALSQAATPSAIGRLAVSRSAELLGADAASAFAVCDAGLEQIHSRGWPEALTRRYRVLPLHRGRPLSDAVLDGAPVWLEDAGQWLQRYPEMAPVHRTGGYEASACLPLRVESRDLGALIFSFLRPRSFAAEERDYLLAVAALCTQALDRARLYVAEQDARAVAEQQRDRMAFLAEAGLLLDAPLSMEKRMQSLADLTVPQIADWCAATLVRGDRIEQVAVAHSDPEKVAFVRHLQNRYPPDPDAAGGSIGVARTGVPSFVPHISDDLLVQVARDDTHLELIRTIGMRSAMVVPLLVRDRSLGSLTLVNAESGRVFDETDLVFAGQLAGRAALALDNARLYEQQRNIAHTLQAALLPATLPEIPGLGLAARYVAQAEGAEVGGDVYDVVAGAEPGTWSLTIADVCGKGPESAALTALIRHTLRAEAGHGVDPAEALRRLNAAILLQAGPHEARFATAVHGRVRADAEGVSLALVSAGHPPAVVLRHSRVEFVTATGTLLGVFPDPELTEAGVRLEQGDTLLLHTDGVTEARDRAGELYGPHRLAATLVRCEGRSADDIADAVLADVLAFQQGHVRDDIAMLVLQAGP